MDYNNNNPYCSVYSGAHVKSSNMFYMRHLTYSHKYEAVRVRYYHDII